MQGEKLANFSRGSVCKPERPVHSFPENQILAFLWRIGNQEQARTVADYIKLKAALGELAFVFAPPKLWHALLGFIRETNSIDSFTRKLMTYLFEKAFRTT